MSRFVDSNQGLNSKTVSPVSSANADMRASRAAPGPTKRKMSEINQAARRSPEAPTRASASKSIPSDKLANSRSRSAANPSSSGPVSSPAGSEVSGDGGVVDGSDSRKVDGADPDGSEPGGVESPWEHAAPIITNAVKSAAIFIGTKIGGAVTYGAPTGLTAEKLENGCNRGPTERITARQPGITPQAKP